MKHAGKAQHAAWRIIFWTLALLVALLGIGWLATLLGKAILAVFSALVLVWVIFVGFTLYFFRDPEARVPQGAGLIVSPAHGTVDVIDETTEAEVMGGPCKRISIFLSVIDVHVQNAPTTGKITFLRHRPGQYLNAMSSACVEANENVLLGLEPQKQPGAKLGVRLVAGLIARRIIPWVAVGDVVARGERLSLIQFGSRVELYLPVSAQIKTQLGQKVVGGETVLATWT